MRCLKKRSTRSTSLLRGKKMLEIKSAWKRMTTQVTNGFRGVGKMLATTNEVNLRREWFWVHFANDISGMIRTQCEKTKTRSRKKTNKMTLSEKLPWPKWQVLTKRTIAYHGFAFRIQKTGLNICASLSTGKSGTESVMHAIQCVPMKRTSFSE